MDIPFVTRQFRKEMKLIVTELNNLLKYNLTFINRAPEKSTIPPIPEDREITSAITSVEGMLRHLDTSSEHVTEIKSMCDELDKMHEQLQKAEEIAGKNACVEQLKAIAQELEDFREWYLIEPELSQIEIINIRTAIDLLQNLIKTCTIERQESTKVVGLKIEERDLVLKLTESSDNSSILCIVGMKGVGKTTLAKAVYYSKDVVKHFPIRVWVTETVGAANKEKVLLMKKDGTKDQTLTMTELGVHLKDKVCLVVLDNVSNTTDFENLYGTLSGSGWTNGSRIMVTTCFKNVALHVNSSSTPYRVRLLTKEESWALFQKVAGIEKPQKKLELKIEKFAKKVVGKCGGACH